MFKLLGLYKEMCKTTAELVFILFFISFFLPFLIGSVPFTGMEENPESTGKKKGA